jgi:hypothetical protein
VASVIQEQFPPRFTANLREELPHLADRIIAAIADEVPSYALPLEGSFGRGIWQGVTVALRRFLDMLDGTTPAGLGAYLQPEAWGDIAGREVYVELGRGEVRSGRSLDALLAAYRAGARLAWSRFAEVAIECGVPAEGLATLAGAMFAYIDGLSAASAEGYAREQTVAAGEIGRRRDALATTLLEGRAAVPAIEEAAAAARWTPPPRLTAVLVDTEHAKTLYGRIDMDALRVVRGDEAWALLGPHRRAALRRTVRDLNAIVGPAMPWSAVHESARRALLARDARDGGWVPAEGTTFADEHLPMLLVHSDQALLADLTRRRLAPLETLPPSSSERLAGTLLAWLALRGERAKVAEALHVHPQTVRYRVRQLRELFGPDLDDPDVRFELELVLRARAGYPKSAASASSDGSTGRSTRPSST